MEIKAITRAVKKNGNEGKIMFDLTITQEVNKLLRQVRKGLRDKGYKESKSRTNRHIGTMHWNYITEYFIKGNLVFEIERDLTRSVITTQLHYNGKEHKEIRLADILSLA